MNSLTSWMQQAKEVTKKFSEMMYIPAEDCSEPERVITDVRSTETMDKAEKVDNSEAVENKENIASNNNSDSIVEPKGDNHIENIGGFDRSKLEANAAATVKVAKQYANSFFSLAKEATVKAAITAEETAKILQNVVTEKTIIGDWDREQTKFNEEVQANKLSTGTLPWCDLPDQWIAKKHILALSLDARNFTRDPPSETSFNFTQMQSVAAALLDEDPNLRKIRFQLVPKQLNEERFWRNYFYRVSLVRQSALDESRSSVAEVPVCSKDMKQDENVKSSAQKKEEQERSEANNDASKIVNKEQNEIENEDSETKDEKLREIRETVANAAQKKAEEDWEKDLVNDFNDYELVSGQVDKTDEQWEEEIAELLDSA